ncbi:hypothetical protein DQG13_02450 [Paenibacillus sp. YN15]|nr:hypothetical protein DQG13_02450 [Paenibacillus sp. YN15]
MYCRKQLVMLLLLVFSFTTILPVAHAGEGFRVGGEKVEIQEEAYDSLAKTVSGNILSAGSDPLQGVLLAALYERSGKMVALSTETFELNGTTPHSFHLSFTVQPDPNLHTIKLLVWDNLQSRQPLSAVKEVNPYERSVTNEEKLNPYLMFVGKVTRGFTDSQAEAKAVTVDVYQYIDLEAKTINSITGELSWDYGIGLNRLNTDRGQAVTGVLNAAASIDLQNVQIESGNAFGTVAVISLDGAPIATSRKLLIQAFTENYPYGFRPEDQADGTKKITAMGGAPMNVRNIDAKVTLKEIADVSKVYALDVNGYVREEIAGTEANGSYTIQLPANTLYTLVERDGIPDPYVHEEVPVKEPVYVWWEGEDTVVRENFPATSEFDANTFPENRNLLSGEDWLAFGQQQIVEGAEPYAKYIIDVPEDGDYSFFIRKFWKHGPFQWRFDEGEWKDLGSYVLLDSVAIRQYLSVNWIAQDNVALTAGTHTFEIKLTMEPDKRTASAIDAFLLTKDAFVPSSLMRPGEKLGYADTGFWAFEPDVVDWSSERRSYIDMSWMNEESAGQSGFVRRDGERMVLGDGREVRFWGVNGGLDTINMSQSQLDNYARKLAKYGVNMFRLHGMVFDDNGNIPDDRLDRLHYMVSTFKKYGIYTNISHYFVLWSDITKSEWYNDEPGTEFSDAYKQPFGLLLFSEQQQQMYKQGVSRMLNTPNPYENGRPLAQEPAIVNIEIQNEDSFLFHTFNPSRYPAKVLKELYGKFGQWLVKEYGSIDAAYDAWGIAAKTWTDDPEQLLMQVEGIGSLAGATGTDSTALRRRDTFRFLVELSQDFYSEMIRFVREDIGYGGLTSASNWITASPQKMEALERYTYEPADWIDRHAYYDAGHKGATTYSVTAGDTYKPVSAVQNPDKLPVKFIHNEDHPSMISEITWTNPTPYTAEGMFFLSAYSALQGIDGVVLFASSANWDTTVQKWPVSTPGMLGQSPVFSWLYRSGAITEAHAVAHEELSLESLFKLKGSRIYEGLNIDDYRK